MQNRWFHTPQIHSPQPGTEKKVEWLELFYDLIFVATFIQLGNALSHNVSVTGFLAFAGLLLPLWLTWTAFTVYSNRFEVDDLAHRLLVFTQMFLIGGMAVSVPAVFAGKTAQFSFIYSGVRLVIVALYLRTYLNLKKGRDMTGRYALGHGAGALLWLVAGFLSAPWVYILWGLAAAIDLGLPLSAPNRALVGRYPPDALHLSERFGLLTLIVLGESFVKVLTEVSTQGATLELAPAGALGLIIVCSLWWLYFDDVAGSHIKRSPLAAFVWLYAHLPLTISVIATGVAIKKAVFFDMSAVAPASYRWLLGSSLALVLFSVGLIDVVTERRQAELGNHARSSTRLGSAVLLVLLAPTGAHLPAWVFLATTSLILGGQVLIDLVMAPLKADRHMLEHGAQAAFGHGISDEGEEDDEKDGDAPPIRHDITSAIRKGTPSELRRDLYYYLMEGSWARLIVVLLTTFVLLNGVFAALYLLEPGSVNEVTNHSFSNAFFFSVQTMSTIGYGVLNPQTDYANVLVTIEAIVGIFGTAISTGLMFAKASRPQAGVVFTDKIVVTRHHGVPTLMLRTGNARGNEIVEASIRVSALIDEVSEEGHALRRMHDLPLMRSESPLFVLTWQVMHQLDEASPLQGLTRDDLDKRVALIIVTLTGHDATYGQTIHARKMYYPEDFVFDHHFVDILKRLPDGRFLVDYDDFHATEPEPQVPN